jgi:hypothetical protein
VGGLPYSVTEGAAAGNLFRARIGRIGQSDLGQAHRTIAGFGFVEMRSGGEAQRAIDSLNGTQLDGRTLTVNEAKPMAPRDNGGGARAVAMNAIAGSRFDIELITGEATDRIAPLFFQLHASAWR